MDLAYDLHIHSCLSPCGDNDMTPGNILGMAVVKGLEVVTISDHNAAGNLPAAQKIILLSSAPVPDKEIGSDPEHEEEIHEENGEFGNIHKRLQSIQPDTINSINGINDLY